MRIVIIGYRSTIIISDHFTQFRCYRKLIMFKGYVTANLVNTTQNKLNSKHEYFDTKHAMALNDAY